MSFVTPTLQILRAANKTLWTNSFSFKRTFVSVTPSSSTPKDVEELQNDLETLIRIRCCGPLLVSLPWHHQGHFGKSDDKLSCIAEGLLEDLQKQYKHVSTPDLLCFASVVAIEVLGGPIIPFSFGRREVVDLGTHSNGNKDESHIREMFSRFNLTDREIVALMGAHSVGRCHTERSGFEGQWTTNPLVFNNSYFLRLVDSDWQEVESSTGKKQFRDGEGHIMLQTDLALLKNPKLKSIVEEYATNLELFHESFSSAFQKLLNFNLPQKE